MRAKLQILIPIPAARAWIAFRDACSAAVHSPQWTECGDDPESWIAPPDAAGRLIWARPGELYRCQPPTRDVEAAVSSALEAASEIGLDSGDVCAAYFSSGGAGVFLLCSDGEYAVAVARGESGYRLGHRGEMLQTHVPSQALQRMRDILWPENDPDRQWSADTICEIADALVAAGYGQHADTICEIAYALGYGQQS